MGVHLVFDLLSVVVAGLGTWAWTREPRRPDGSNPGATAPGYAAEPELPAPRRPGLDPGPRPGVHHPGVHDPGAPPPALEARLGIAGREGYLAALSLGILAGSYLLGTGNLWLSGVPGLGRSILGALTGGIVAVELWKAAHGVKGSTGWAFIPTFCLLVAVGRIGCALSGLEDQTYGIPTSLPWGHDFGDGIPRHPVALYESLAMAAFLALAWPFRERLRPHGFHLMVAVYAAQRFGLEFLKPYGPLLGPLNLFHMTCAGLLAYAAVMVRK